MLKIKVTTDPKITEFMRTIPRLMADIKKVMGRKVASELKAEVLRRIPNEKGWYKIYRDSVTFYELPSGDRWGVVGRTNATLTTIPAHNSLIFFNDSVTDEGGPTSEDAENPDFKVLAILKKYNPFTVDTLPSLQGGIKIPTNARPVVVEPASISKVKKAREDLRDVADQIRNRLEKEAGAKLADRDKFPKINGKLYIDIAFLSMRLEYGLEGFRKVKHWQPAMKAVKTNVPKWLAEPDIQKELERAVNGKPLASDATILPNDIIKKIRKLKV